MNLAALVRRICEGSLPKSNLTNSDELSPRPVGPIHGHHLHRPFLIETHHRHLTLYLYHGLAIAWVGLLWGERKHGPLQLAQYCEDLLTFYSQNIKPVKPQ
jgi:hypothetical protein